MVFGFFHFGSIGRMVADFFPVHSLGRLVTGFLETLCTASIMQANSGASEQLAGYMVGNFGQSPKSGWPFPAANPVLLFLLAARNQEAFVAEMVQVYSQIVADLV
jgi:hypothetical protein